MCDGAAGLEAPHLCGRVHGGLELQQLSDDFHVALLGGQMESIQTILGGEQGHNQETREPLLIGLQNMWGGVFAQSITHEPLSRSFGIQLRQQCENEYSDIPFL